MPNRPPVIVMAHSPRSWTRTLKQHVIDHGGGRIMASIMHAEDTLAEGYDVLVADDTTSFLSRKLVADLQHRRVAVVGVYDPQEEEATGRQRLLDLHVDEAVALDTPPAELLRVLTRAATRRAGSYDDEFAALVADIAGEGPFPDTEYARPTGSKRGSLILVTGASGGVGATEIAVGVARGVGAGVGRTVLVDADDVGPSIAQRLGLEVHPNLLSAVDIVVNQVGDLGEVSKKVPLGSFEVVTGLASRRDWFELRPVDVAGTLLEIARLFDHVVVNVSSRIEDLPSMGGPARYGVARSLLALADGVILVAGSTPIGVARVMDWIAEAEPLLQATQLHVVFNEFEGGPYKAAEIEEELRHVYQPRSVSFLPHDRRLAHATWQGRLPERGPFQKGVRKLSSLIAVPDRRGSRR